MKSSFLLPLIVSLLTCSCNVYNGAFDCPPAKGVGCQSVTQIEDQIMENEKGPDIFIAEETKKQPPKKVWMKNSEGEGYYIYI